MKQSNSENQTALVVVLSNVATDPRVRRQISWLTSEGWTVDTLGLGAAPEVPLRDHFALAARSRLSRSGPMLGLTHLLPYRARFHILSGRLFPQGVVRRVRSQDYDLILFNDTHLLPWLTNKSLFPQQATKVHIHLDLHEYFPVDIPKMTRGRKLMNGFYRWGRSLIGHPSISSRSVAAGMGDQYASEFEVPRPLLVRNCPPYTEQSPTLVDPERIELIHHGIAAWQRGFKEMIDAMRIVEERFVLTFMLAGNSKTIQELQAYIGDMQHRIFVVPPVPMTTLSTEVNKYDAEVMFFPPNTKNAVFGLPNKIFEAIQGRLALIIGPTAPMVDIVREAGNGVVAHDWSAEALAEAINSLSAGNIVEMKEASHRIASRYNAETEKATFLKSFSNIE